MATKTPNYGLTKPADTDFYDVKVFNDNADIVDRELKSTAEALDTVRNATMYYGKCLNDVLAANKTVNCPGFILAVGVRIAVTFTPNHAVASPTLNVENTGAYPIYKDGRGIGSSGAWVSGATIEFVFDGTYWRIIS